MSSDDNKKILYLENEIKRLNSDLDKQNDVVEKTKEYLFILEYENVKKQDKLYSVEKDYINKLNEQVAIHNDEIKEQKKKNDKLIIDLKKNYENKINRLEKDNKKLHKEISQRKNEIFMLKSTFSWKITKPLRKLKNLIR